MFWVGFLLWSLLWVVAGLGGMVAADTSMSILWFGSWLGSALVSEGSSTSGWVVGVGLSISSMDVSRSVFISIVCRAVTLCSHLLQNQCKPFILGRGSRVPTVSW